MVFCAHICQRNPGILNTHHMLHIGRAHHAELLEHFGTAFHIGSAVDEHEETVVFGHHRGKRHTLHAFDALDNHVCTEYQRTAVAGRNKRVSVPCSQTAQAFCQRTTAFFLHNALGGVVHGHHVRGFGNFHAVQGNIVFRKAGIGIKRFSLPRHRRKEGHRHPVVELRVLAADGNLQRVLIERFDALAFKLRKINA